MSRFSKMEWNDTSKWDWENIVSFGSKPIESPKKLQQAEWMVVDNEEMNPPPYNLSRFGGYNSSDGGHNSSSISASTDSSTRDMRFKTTSGNLSKKMECSTNSSPLEASSAAPVEPLIGLKLGKRTYFENNTTFTVMPTPSTTTLKKNKPGTQTASVFCQVEGCSVDLLGAKDYHRKHKVCDNHSKFPKVIVGGQERRFCQQCSRFHSLCEFDEKKRSCRRRLSDHNARRRKPQPETIQFNSARRLSSPFYGGTSFVVNNPNSPPVHNHRTPGNNIWDRVSDPRLTLARGKFPHAINVQNAANFNPGSKRSSVISPPSLDAAQDRALSLLSSNSWGSQHIPLQNLMHHSMIHPTPEGVPLSPADFWAAGQQTMHPNIAGSSSNFQDSQLFKTPYEADFYSGMLN